MGQGWDRAIGSKIKLKLEWALSGTLCPKRLVISRGPSTPASKQAQAAVQRCEEQCKPKGSSKGARSSVGVRGRGGARVRGSAPLVEVELLEVVGIPFKTHQQAAKGDVHLAE